MAELSPGDEPTAMPIERLRASVDAIAAAARHHNGPRQNFRFLPHPSGDVSALVLHRGWRQWDVVGTLAPHRTGDTLAFESRMGWLAPQLDMALASAIRHRSRHAQAPPIEAQAPPQGPRAMGIETEYAIEARDEAGMLVRNSMAVLDVAREVARPTSIAGPVRGEDLFPTIFLADGSKFTADPGDPRRELVRFLELSTVECTDARELASRDHQADCTAIELAERVADVLGADTGGVVHVTVSKDSLRFRGFRHGSHENHTLPHAVDREKLVKHLLPHLVARTPLCSTGAVEQIGDHFEARMSGRSTSIRLAEELPRRKRFEPNRIEQPMIRFKDDTHCSELIGRRLEVMCGDSTLTPLSTWLRVGSTDLVLRAATNGIALPDLRMTAPVASLRRASRDLTLRQSFDFGGSAMRLLDAERLLIDSLAPWVHADGTDDDRLLLQHWSATIEGLDTDPRSQRDVVDWVGAFMNNTGTTINKSSWGDIVHSVQARMGDRTEALAMRVGIGRYHDITDTTHARLHLVGLTDPTGAFDARPLNPSTRAGFRTEVAAAATAAHFIVDQSWSHITLRRNKTRVDIDMLDPTQAPVRWATSDVVRALTAFTAEGSFAAEL